MLDFEDTDDILDYDDYWTDEDAEERCSLCNRILNWDETGICDDCFEDIWEGDAQ